MLWQVALCLIVIVIEPQLAQNFHPCKQNFDIVVYYKIGRPPGDKNQYNLNINEDLPAQSEVKLKFNSDATLKLTNSTAMMRKVANGAFLVKLLEKTSNLNVDVKGPATGTVPYLQSVVIDTQEYCNRPGNGYLDNFIKGNQTTVQKKITDNKSKYFPCKQNFDIVISYKDGRPLEENNQYNLDIEEELQAQSEVILIFDSDTVLRLLNPSSARITPNANDNFSIKLLEKASNLNVDVNGPPNGTIPYLRSVVIDTQEYCNRPNTGYLDHLIEGYQIKHKKTIQTVNAVSSKEQTNFKETHLTCGRRKIGYTELIVNGERTKPGDWPWHAAIYRLERATVKYICGGTLISKTMVLTAAHCATIRGVPVLPDILSVVLGKYNLIGGDVEIQEREVHQIIVHENFEYKMLNNDIALLKLRSEAVYSHYVQPACIWYADASKKLPPGQMLGTVVGWGFDQTDKVSPTLRQAIIPEVSEITCIKSNPVFFTNLLTKQKFCAGWNNGTSACNGDSGGSFTVFVPDTLGDVSANAIGTWHIRGIVSLSISRRDAAICDPYQYVLFTDVAEFTSWLKKYM